MEIALMIEGQNGLDWPRWMRISRLAEDLGFIGLFRSDHFTNANPPDLDSLELWVSLTWLASHTQRLEFGPLVTPVSFRHPVLTARMAAALDDLSGGRFILGVGAGWQAREHQHFGFEMLDPEARFDRFEEGLQVIKRLLSSDTPVDFRGKYFSLQEAILLPRPARKGGPPLLIGGNGRLRTLSLVARYADEWNGLLIPAERVSQLNRRLDGLLAAQNRDPKQVRRSLMTGCVFGVTRAEVETKVQARTHGKSSPADLRKRGILLGTVDEVSDQLAEFSSAGVQRLMLQWLDLDDLDSLKILARGIIR
jgi:F420-dependent oxidoreductase-like protein